MQPQPFRFLFHPHTVYVCCLLVSPVCPCLYIYVSVFFLSSSLSDLDCPVVWGAPSGLLLFSCSLRYLFHRLAPSALNLPPLLCLHFIVLDPKLGDLRCETNKCTFFFSDSVEIHSDHTCFCPDTYAFRDNIITGYIHLGAPTVDPCARSTIGEAQESIRSQLLCNWVRY